MSDAAGSGDERPRGTVDLAAIQQFFADGIPFNTYLGLRVTAIDRGRMEVEVPFRAELIGDPTRPALHGGVISSMADAAGGGAVFTLTDPGDRVATIDLRVDYLRPGRSEPIRAVARVVRIGNRVGVSSIEVFHPGEADRPIAVGKGVYTIKRARPDPEP